MKPSYTSSSFKNPSRKSCERIIEKILSRELEEYGANQHFKQASDFMSYFEALYPASASLTKQVQRAVSSMHLPRDEHGYFMIHKTGEEYNAERELARMLSSASLVNLESCTPFLLKTASWQCEHVIHLMESVPSIQNLYETSFKVNNGILIYTRTPDKLSSILSSFLKNEEDQSSKDL